MTKAPIAAKSHCRKSDYRLSYFAGVRTGSSAELAPRQIATAQQARFDVSFVTATRFKVKRQFLRIDRWWGMELFKKHSRFSTYS